MNEKVKALGGAEIYLSEYDVEKTIRSLTIKLEDAAIKATAPKVDYGMTENEKDLALNGHKIPAIRDVRQRTGLGLKEAKDRVDKFMDDQNMIYSSVHGKYVKR
jgi:ribosomal protein L7/L12